MFQQRKSVLARLKRVTKKHKLAKVAQKVPQPHKLKPIPGRVLEEDDYVNSLEKIIQRDYYPDLPRLRATQKLFDATQERNPKKIEIAQRNLECLTPATQAGATPLTCIADNESVMGSTVACTNLKLPISQSSSSEDNVRLLDGREVKLDLAKTRLDSFQGRYTSQDNASFDEIVTNEKKALAEKQWWIENAATRHNESVLQTLRELVPKDDELLPITDDGKGVHTSAPAAPSTLLFTASEPRNALIFHPSESYNSNQQEPKVIANKNTRFPSASQDSDVLLEKQREKHRLLSRRNFDDKLLSQMVSRGEFALTEGEDQLDNSCSMGYEGLKDPTYAVESVDGFTFEKTPLLVPGVGPDASPLMTWGQVASVPLVLNSWDTPSSTSNGDYLNQQAYTLRSAAESVNGDDASGPRFVVLEQSKKEATAHKLAERRTRNCAFSSRSEKVKRCRLLFSKLSDLAALDASRRKI